MEQAYTGSFTGPFYASVSQILLPVVTGAVIAVRALAGGKKEP
jgi:hypothetical protein